MTVLPSGSPWSNSCGSRYVGMSGLRTLSNAVAIVGRVLQAVARNRATIIVPGQWRILWWINRLSPSLGRYVAHRMYQPLVEAVASEQARSARSGAD